ncbi:MAG: hypothetical protein QW666_01095 [Candidatus Woesearchaeota archaeon]
MEKLNLIIVITAIVLVGLAVTFKMIAPTGAAVTTTGGALGGNLVTVVAVIAIAGIVMLTIYKKFE